MSAADWPPLDPEKCLQRYFFHGKSKEPWETPVGRLLKERGVEAEVVPIDQEWAPGHLLGLRFPWGSVRITVRQPTDEDLLLCMIERPTTRHGMRAALLDLVDFIDTVGPSGRYVRTIGGCVQKAGDQEEELEGAKLADFYRRIIGDVVTIPHQGYLWIFADTHAPKRLENPIWRRRRRKNR